ncbi:hypothetical protein [Longimicrobium sp.]|uniref:hypothetical protein n=1 Tax=Longimicrobium sp. TaxID=2029185 RepID=UPI002CFFBB76|nr:hypothetical protein [Longimicrobium sp.]HSU16156.1 hypothetical protein [Longimicrobium sp.]
MVGERWTKLPVIAPAKQGSSRPVDDPEAVVAAQVKMATRNLRVARIRIEV